jgi:hypothetical protein
MDIMSGHKQRSQFELKNKQTIERFGRDKCLEVYEMPGKHIPLKPGQMYATWQEKVSAEHGISEDEAMDLWAAGNSIIQEKQFASSEGIISKVGEDKCKEIFAEMLKIMTSDSDWQKTISEKYNIEQSNVIDVFLAGSSISMKESAPSINETMKEYHQNKHKLPSCPKKECNGKLHITVSLSEENDGLYLCDNCSSTFRKKK